MFLPVLLVGPVFVCGTCGGPSGSGFRCSSLERVLSVSRLF